MIQRIVATMEELGFVRNENEKERLLGWSVPEVMENFVFPRCLCLPRSGRRYPRIDGSFMELMARHGKDFLTADYELGSVLLELAMQRITKHPDLPAIEYYKILPEKWRAYSAASSNPEGMNGCPDEPGLWGERKNISGLGLLTADAAGVPQAQGAEVRRPCKAYPLSGSKSAVQRALFVAQR